MNKRLTNKVITKKHEDFLKSVKDDEVRELINNNSVITGGSIVSLLTNEPVSDYDYYFTDKNTAIKVAQYYVDEWITAHPDGVKPEVISDEETERVKIVIQSKGIVGEDGVVDEVGESYLENVHNETDSNTIEELAEGEKYRPVFLSANAITLSDKVQLVIRFHGDPEEIHKNYDFVHCTNYWLSKDRRLVLNQAALESILSKNLVYQGSIYPVCSVIRTRKFLKRGWYINAGQYLKMCFQISELDLSNIEVLEEQLTGVDALYFHQVIAYCRKRQEEDSSFHITSPYLVEVIDRIF